MLAPHDIGANRSGGQDFDEARLEAMRIAEAGNYIPVPPFHRELVRGVSTYGYELFSAHPDLDTVYVPIGCGSGICGVIAARDALGLDCERPWPIAGGGSTRLYHFRSQETRLCPLTGEPQRGRAFDASGRSARYLCL